jgi:signal transduction histidine kinase
LDAFAYEDQELMEILATNVAVALNNERLFRIQRERQTREQVAQMATGIIHDVNNLISNIPDVVEELRNELKGARNNEAIEEYLHDLQSSATSTHRISSKLRDFVIGREFKPVQSDIAALIRRVIADLMPSKPNHVEIEFSQHALLPKVKVDPLWVEQLFSNLIHNAFEAIPSSRYGHVVVSSWLDQKKIWVAIQDNGSGIAMDLWDKIFQPGFTTKRVPARLHGIGLYFCQQVALAHHGEIKMQSVPGSETTFTVTFPVGTKLKEENSLAY